ncbi:MAG: hypothetical protein CMN85_10650 [Spongiibacteraceae bacterium]|nr:hypothetical protein [Spongiibacteraceae bacterium]
MERAYLGDRFEWVSLGWDGLNGRANFCNEDAPSDRWDQYWKSGVKEPSRGNGALIVGQVTGDMATVGVNLNEWAKSVANGLSACGVPWSYRPHPQSLRRGQRQPFTADPRSFDEAISQCDSVITYNSNVGVLAAMAGKRVTCENDGAMAWEVAGHGWQDDKDLGDRDEWGRKLAYCQWLPHEVEAGDFWPTLSRIFE